MKERVMVCVTRQKSCERLIKYGATLASQTGMPLLVVHALGDNQNVLGNEQESEALEWLFQKTSDENGELMMLRTENVEDTIAECAVSQNVSVIIMGQSPASNDNFAERLKMRMPKVRFIVIESSAETL